MAVRQLAIQVDDFKRGYDIVALRGNLETINGKIINPVDEHIDYISFMELNLADSPQRLMNEKVRNVQKRELVRSFVQNLRNSV